MLSGIGSDGGRELEGVWIGVGGAILGLDWLSTVELLAPVAAPMAAPTPSLPPSAPIACFMMERIVTLQARSVVIA